MKSISNSIRHSFLIAIGLVTAAFSSRAQTATATISGVPSGGSYNYTITLQNTGTLALNSFWYGWTITGNNLPSDPSSPANSLGWGNRVFNNNSIEWVNNTGTALAPGASATFTFISTSSPTAITTPPSGESVAYVGGIDFSQGQSGDSTGAFSPTLISGPLPPVIIHQPQSQTVPTNATVTFSVTASNATSYQWQSNTVTLEGQTNDSLTLSNVVAADAASYRVVVGNASGSVDSSNAVLTVTTPAPIMKNQLTVAINPAKSGSVSPNLNGKILMVNHSYTVKAVPGKGQVFTNWSGIVQSDNPVLTFVMPSVSNATLTANFIPSPFASNGVVGTYTGLFWDTNNLSNESAGWFSATVTANGVMDGQVKIAGASTTFTTTLLADGTGSLELARHNEASLVLTIKVDLSGGETLSGMVSDSSNSFNAQLYAYRAGFSAANLAKNYEGYYTWAMPAVSGIAPAGHSFGSATVLAAGAVQMSLILGDGTKTTAAGSLSTTGMMPLYLSLYGGKGSMLAWLSFSNSAGTLSTNGAYWFRDSITLFKDPPPARVTGPSRYAVKTDLFPSGVVPITVATGPFPDGFTLTNLWLYVAAYTPEAKGINAFDAASIDVQLSGADLTNTVSNTIAVNSAGVGGSSATLSVSVSGKTGLFSGSFKDSVVNAPARYQGVVIQPWLTGYGNFISGGLSGATLIEPTSALFLATIGTNIQISPEFNEANNILIADQWNNRVIEATPAGRIIWSFGLGPNDFSSNSVIGCNDAERVGDYTLMAGTGDVGGVIPQSPTGAVDNRVVLADPDGEIVWQYGQFGQTGAGSNLLNTPVQCTFVPGFNVLITDQGNNRIIEVNYDKEITWQYPGADTNAADQLNGPNSAELLANGHILIADQGNSRALEVTTNDEIVKTFTAGGTVNILAFASRLENGDTLLTDAGNARIVEVNAEDHVVWQYYTDTNSFSVPAPTPTRAVRLRNGDTLISDQLNNRVISVNHAGKIVASYGLPLASGTYFSGIDNNVGYSLYSTQAGLYSPYDAKIIGDYTGLTPPLAP
jgi:hypothetical protein